MKSNYSRLAVAAVLLAAAAAARAEDAPQEEAKPDNHGLPAGTDWKLDFSAGWGFFGFGNSLYANSHDEVQQDLSDNWMEGFVKGGFSGTHKLNGGGEFYGAISGVGERTYNAPPPLVGGEASSFDIEDLYLGWRSGDMLGLGENALDFVVGRTQYKLGHGMLIYDGASEGGSRGGFWSGARKAYEFAAIGRVHAGPTLIEAFYLDRDELPESDSASATYGVNFEYSWNERQHPGRQYTSWTANGFAARTRRSRHVEHARLAHADSLVEGPLLRARVRQGRQRRPARQQCLERAGRLAVRRRLEAEALVSLRGVRGRRPEHGEERILRRPVDRLLRLGHLVAGRNRRRVLSLERQPDLEQVRVHTSPTSRSAPGSSSTTSTSTHRLRRCHSDNIGASSTGTWTGR
jgi:opacity protein-like surface antigen